MPIILQVPLQGVWTESAWYQMISLLLLCLQCSRKANFTVKWIFKSDKREEQDRLKIKGTERRTRTGRGLNSPPMCFESPLEMHSSLSSGQEYSGRNTVESAEADELNLV